MSEESPQLPGHLATDNFAPTIETMEETTPKNSGLSRYPEFDDLSPSKKAQRWTEEEDETLKRAVEVHGGCSWKAIADAVGTRNDLQCFHRWQKVLKPGLTKGPWTEMEDEIILDMVQKGVTRWCKIAQEIPGRLGKQIRERYYNHLDPSIKKEPWSTEEDNILMNAQQVHGNKWAKIAKLLPGRPENTVKNRYNVLKYPRKRTKPNKKRTGSERPKKVKREKPMDQITEIDEAELEEENYENYLNDGCSGLDPNSIVEAARLLISLHSNRD